MTIFKLVNLKITNVEKYIFFLIFVLLIFLVNLLFMKIIKLIEVMRLLKVTFNLDKVSGDLFLDFTINFVYFNNFDYCNILYIRNVLATYILYIFELRYLCFSIKPSIVGILHSLRPT